MIRVMYLRIALVANWILKGVDHWSGVSDREGGALHSEVSGVRRSPLELLPILTIFEKVVIFADLDVATDGLSTCSLPARAEAGSAFSWVSREAFDEGLVLQRFKSERLLGIFKVQSIL